MNESWKSVVIWAVTVLSVAMVILGIVAAVFFNAESKRDALRECMSAAGAPSSTDCRHAVYGSSR